MSHTSSDWERQFIELFNQSAEKYRQGHEKVDGFVDAKGLEFLKSIGHTEQEFFDFVEDYVKSGNPTPEVSLKIAAVRRDYFLQEQKGKTSSHLISVDKLPSKDAAVEGIGWLPRIIPKAEAKLRGEMPPELMFGCGGDRHFFHTHQIDASEFLKKVWNAKGNQSEIVSWVKANSKA